MTQRISLFTQIPSGTSDTNVTAPPGLNVCCHLRGASWAFASTSISQTVRPENSYARPSFILLPRWFCMQASFLHFSCSCSSLPFSSSFFFLFSPPSILLTTCLASAEIECEVSHFCHQDKGLWVCVGCVRAIAANARDLWGLQACWTFYFPHQSPCRCAEVGSICWVSVRLPSQPTQGPLTMPQVHLEYKPNGTHLVLDRWTCLVKKNRLRLPAVATWFGWKMLMNALHFFQYMSAGVCRFDLWSGLRM